MKSKLSLILILFICFVSCEKEYEVANSIPQFTGIQERDINGQHQTNGLSDPTDWLLNDDWNELENSLFDSLEFYNNCSVLNRNVSISAYPNPCNGFIYVLSTMDMKYKSKIRIVDQNFKIIYSSNNSHTNIFGNAIGFDISNYKNQFLRVYYILLDENNCAFKGHGDIIAY